MTLKAKYILNPEQLQKQREPNGNTGLSKCENRFSNFVPHHNLNRGVYM